MTFKNHGRQIRQNLKVTFGNWTTLDVHNNSTNFKGWNEFWGRMSPADREWAEKFERLEYQIERGYGVESRAIATELNPSIASEALQRITEDVATKDRCNPQKVERYNTRNEKDRKTHRIAKDKYYDGSDWNKTGGSIPSDDETDSQGEPVMIEKGITLNPEDALIQALDAAAVHGVSLETFVNDARYHTQPRKAGRPKKVKE